PTETRQDLDDLIVLIKHLEKIPQKKSALRISVNPFIPKPHTPFQWHEIDLEHLKRDVKYLKSQLRKSNLKIDSPRMALIQYVLSHGSSDLGDLIQRSINNKIPLKEWEKVAPKWDLNSLLPWNNVDVGIKKEFLKEEYQKALKGSLTPWCETFGCYDCGSCLNPSQ
ncbi:MAG: radical SAM protein, partial [Methanobacterium sp.]|nr:radical SAM protein [Methanobacterium sp.]